MPKNYNGIIGSPQKRRDDYSPIPIGDIRTVSDEEWAEHWRPHGSGWRNPSPDNIKYLERAYGGSDMGVIMGVSHFKSRLELYHQKIGTKTVFTRNGNSDAKDLGHLYEVTTALKYQKFRFRNEEDVILYADGKIFEPNGKMRIGDDGFEIDEPFSMLMYRDGRKGGNNALNLRYPYALANCDGFIDDMDLIAKYGANYRGLLEIKTTSSRNYEVIEDWKKGIVPQGYFWQCVFYMSVLNIMFTDIVCSWGQGFDEMAVVRIYRDYDVEEKLFNALEQFDSYVANQIEPDADFDDPDLLINYYYELFGPTTERNDMVELPDKFKPLIREAQLLEKQLAEAQAEVARIEKEKSRIFSKLYPVFKTATYGQCKLDEKTTAAITLKIPMKRAKFDEETFKKDHPLEYEKYKVFSATELGKEDKRLKTLYTLPAEPNLEDKTKIPTFSLKIKEED